MFPRHHEQRDMYEARRAGGKCYDTMGVYKTEQNRGPSCRPPSCMSSTVDVSYQYVCLSLCLACSQFTLGKLVR